MIFRLALAVALLVCFVDARLDTSGWLEDILGKDYWSPALGVTNNIKIYCCPRNKIHKRHAFCTSIAHNVTENIIKLCYTVTEDLCDLLPSQDFRRECLTATHKLFCSKVAKLAAHPGDHDSHSQKCKRAHLAWLPLEVARTCDKAFKYALPLGEKADPNDDTLCPALKPAANQACTEKIYELCSTYSPHPAIDSACRTLGPSFLCV